jgi:hypothetical protein
MPEKNVTYIQQHLHYDGSGSHMLNGQMLATSKLAHKQKKGEPVIKANMISNQHRNHKVLLMSDSHGGECAERIKKSATL